jgi:hypothetical protein
VGATDAGVDGGTDAGDGTDGGDGDGTSSGRRTTTTRRSGGTTATTAAPTTTTTLQGVLRNSACSSEGATARDKVTGGTLTCQRSCTSNRLQWRAGPCPTNPTPPTNQPGQTLPTNPDQEL